MVTLVEHLCGKGHPVRIYDEHLALQRLEGANLSFALQSIPHLSDLLSHDLKSVIEASDVVVVCHRLTPEKWREVSWRDEQQIVDLVNVVELQSHPRYDGLYW